MGAIFWGIMTTVFAILEVILPGLVTIWMSLAAFVVMFLSFFINNKFVEAIIWVILSFVFIYLTRPLVKKYVNTDKGIFDSKQRGHKLKIEKVVDNNRYEVKYKGSIWTAISEENLTIGDIVEIKDFEGNKIVVSKVNL